MHSQYQSLADENAKLSQEIAMLKYRIITMNDEYERQTKQMAEETVRRQKTEQNVLKLQESCEHLQGVF